VGGRKIPGTPDGSVGPPRARLLPGRPEPGAARERFEALDRYRVDREWQRYEGTAQRELFRLLRVRFLRRNVAVGRWVVDIGAGPGRFLGAIGPPDADRIALDLSQEMLRRVDLTTRPRPYRVRGDGISPPLAPGRFSDVAVLGNALGFAGADSERLLSEAEALVAPGGMLLLEVVSGPGERSRYLSRLPPTALARLLRAPVAALATRVGREGFAEEPRRRRDTGDFRRFDPSDLSSRLVARGWQVVDTLAIAPALGPVAGSLAAVRADEKAWAHLLELEERVGRQPERWPRAAAVLLALSRARPMVGKIK
jgi:SAM-dependent methyltransferase